MKFLDTLVGAHVARYPAMRPVDVYKLLYQAAMGNGHLVSAPDALVSLRREIAEAGEGPAEPLFDPISPDGRLGRVHLRAFRARGLAADELAMAFARSAETWLPAPAKLAKFCGCLAELAGTRVLPFSVDEVAALVADIEAKGYPVVRHSDAYREAYRPAYRVVDREACGAWIED
jgi:hypothetical protein